MKQGMSALKKGESHYVQTEWGTFHVSKGLPRLGPRYDFLKDPNPRQRLTKIKKEIHHAQNKLKRKQSDRLLLFLFLIFTTCFVAFLCYNQTYSGTMDAQVLFTGTLTGIYLLAVYIVSRSILIPAAKNMKYLKLKLQFLTQKKEEAFMQGQATSNNPGNNSMNRI